MVIHKFNYGRGNAEIYIGSGQTVFVKTALGTYDTGFKKASGSGGCDYLNGAGSCRTAKQMIAEVTSKTNSNGGYNR